MSDLTLYHGSPEIVEKTAYGKGAVYNDYGRGFYCTEEEELAKEWACSGNSDGYVNQYEFRTEKLNILNLSTEEYTILHWLALLMENRRVSLATPMMEQGAAWLRNHFLPDIRPYDVIIGYRADDSYFSFVRAFVGNEISLEQLRCVMMLGEWKEQIALKSKKAFERIRFVSFEPVECSAYYPLCRRRDDTARAAYRAELEKTVLEGWFIRDLMREEVSADDPRIH